MFSWFSTGQAIPNHTHAKLAHRSQAEERSKMHTLHSAKRQVASSCRLQPIQVRIQNQLCVGIYRIVCCIVAEHLLGAVCCSVSPARPHSTNIFFCLLTIIFRTNRQLVHLHQFDTQCEQRIIIYVRSVAESQLSLLSLSHCEREILSSTQLCDLNYTIS